METWRWPDYTAQRRDVPDAQPQPGFEAQSQIIGDPAWGLAESGQVGAVYTAPVSGGLQTAGTAPIARVVVRTVTLTGGSIQLGGTAAKALVRDVAPLGGVQIAGTAPVSRLKASQVSGGILTGGTALKALTKAPAASGGAVTAGTAAASLLAAGATVRTYIPTGGVLLGGSALTSFSGKVIEQSGHHRLGIEYLETIRDLSDPKRTPGRASDDLVDQFLAKSRAYKGRGKVRVGAAGKVRQGSAATAFVYATLDRTSAEALAATARAAAEIARPAVLFETVGSGSVRVGGEAETFPFDSFWLARIEDLDLLTIG